MISLLNISTHPSDLAVIDHDWSLARAILASHDFDGYELYPVQGYPFDEIPADLIHGLHLPFDLIEPEYVVFEIFTSADDISDLDLPCEIIGQIHE